jgi:hypothetical protein
MLFSKSVIKRIKCTKEQAEKLERGLSAINDIKMKVKVFEKELSLTESDELDKSSELNQKISMLKGILNALKKKDIEAARIIGFEYEKLYPDDFRD